MADSDSRHEPIKIVLPTEPPDLTPAAARTLLRILVKAYEKQTGNDAHATNVGESRKVQRVE
jgi:hypothetical protein